MKATTAEIIQSLEIHLGFLTDVAKHVGMTLQGLVGRIKSNKSLQDKVAEIYEKRLDMWEKGHMQICVDPNVPPAIRLKGIMYGLNSKGKARGYGANSLNEKDNEKDNEIEVEIYMPKEDDVP